MEAAVGLARHDTIVPCGRDCASPTKDTSQGGAMFRNPVRPVGAPGAAHPNRADLAESPGFARGN